MSIEIITLTELVERKITQATMWSDCSSMSLALDNGGILQITPRGDELHYEIEYAPPKKRRKKG